MKTSEPADLTELLRHWRQGDEDAASQLLGVVYRDLRRIAGKYMRGERPSHTLQATALVHEAWMRLSRSPNAPVASREQFFRAMAAYMRRHLVDHARRRQAVKRGVGTPAVDINDSVALLATPAPESDVHLEEELTQLDAALAELNASHPRAAKVLELRFFGNKSIDEAAEALSVASGTVKRDFAFARSFLLSRMPVAGPSSSPR
jgi:RNA polymerase sigma factor (TIGR02999 family)